MKHSCVNCRLFRRKNNFCKMRRERAVEPDEVNDCRFFTGIIPMALINKYFRAVIRCPLCDFDSESETLVKAHIHDEHSILEVVKLLGWKE